MNNITKNNAAASSIGDMMVDERLCGVLQMGCGWGVFWEGSCYAGGMTLDAAVVYYKKMVEQML